MHQNYVSHTVGRSWVKCCIALAVTHWRKISTVQCLVAFCPRPFFVGVDDFNKMCHIMLTVHVLLPVTSESEGDSCGVSSDKAAEPVTTVQVCICKCEPTGYWRKPCDNFQSHSSRQNWVFLRRIRTSPAIFVVTKTSSLNQTMMFSWT